MEGGGGSGPPYLRPLAGVLGGGRAFPGVDSTAVPETSLSPPPPPPPRDFPAPGVPRPALPVGSRAAAPAGDFAESVASGTGRAARGGDAEPSRRRASRILTKSVSTTATVRCVRRKLDGNQPSASPESARTSDQPPRRWPLSTVHQSPSLPATSSILCMHPEGRTPL